MPAPPECWRVLECGGAPPLLGTCYSTVATKLSLPLNASVLNLYIDRTNRHGCHDLNSLEIHLPTKHTKDTKISEAKIDEFMFPLPTDARIPFSDNGQSSRSGLACSPLRRGSSKPAPGVHQSIGRPL